MLINMKVNGKGFTLMEIMVVIIVIAVLASVAGPMIGTITDQGRASATKAQMTNIKSALINYKSDIGHFPHNCMTAPAKSGGNYSSADTILMNNNIDTNTLSNNAVVCGTLNLYGIPLATWNARHKGPYMDSDPSDFMMDGWSNKIVYLHSCKTIWLHSFGPDGSNDTSAAPPENITKESYTGDDIVQSVARVAF